MEKTNETTRAVQAPADSTQGKEITWNDDEYYEASFGIHKSRRYNAKRRDFYQSIHDVIKALNVFAASGVFFAVMGAMVNFGAGLAAIVALASLLDIVFGFEKKARLHSELTHEFSEIAAKLEEWDATAQNLRVAKAERIRIESREPSVKRLIDLMADNEEARARGALENDLMPLSRLQRTLGYIFTFGMKRLEEWKAEYERSSIDKLEETKAPQKTKAN